MEISKKVQYERIKNGADIHLLKTATKDIVVAKLGIRGGKRVLYDNPVVAQLFQEMLPGSTKNKKKYEILDTFEKLGARVSVSFSNEYAVFSLFSRSANFTKALDLFVEVIVAPSFLKHEFEISRRRLYNMLQNSNENTTYLSNVALSKLLFNKEHPHWLADNKELQEQLTHTGQKMLQTMYKRTITSTGMIVVIAGDVGKDTSKKVANVISKVPQRNVLETRLHPEKVKVSKRMDTVVSVKDKENIDTQLGIPLFITTNSSDYFAFMFGISILGRSSTSRLFNIMRTKESLTYGASAHILGGEREYPLFLKCSTILPSEMFLKGRSVMRNVVKDFAEKGVTPKEVKDKKIEFFGNYSVALSMTAGLCEEMFVHLLRNEPIREIDLFKERVESMTTKKVNDAIFSHIDYSLAKTAAAGAVRPDGTPIK